MSFKKTIGIVSLIAVAGAAAPAFADIASVNSIVPEEFLAYAGDYTGITIDHVGLNYHVADVSPSAYALNASDGFVGWFSADAATKYAFSSAESFTFNVDITVLAPGQAQAGFYFGGSNVLFPVVHYQGDAYPAVTHVSLQYVGSNDGAPSMSVFTNGALAGSLPAAFPAASTFNVGYELDAIFDNNGTPVEVSFSNASISAGIPSPATISLLALGGLFAGRRRR